MGDSQTPMTDDAVLNQLLLTRDGVINTRLELLKNPKPNYNIDGQDIKWADYLKLLNDSLGVLTKQIAEYQGLYEEESVWYC
jgi:hypothetical protein